MPFGGPYLQQSTIDVIRQWITNGAPQSSSSPSGAAASGKGGYATLRRDRDISRDDQSIVSSELPRIVVAFNNDIDSTLLNNTTVTLEKLGVTPPNPQLPASARQPCRKAILPRS